MSDHGPATTTACARLADGRGLLVVGLGEGATAHLAAGEFCVLALPAGHLGAAPLVVAITAAAGTAAELMALAAEWAAGLESGALCVDPGAPLEP